MLMVRCSILETPVPTGEMDIYRTPLPTTISRPTPTVPETPTPERTMNIPFLLTGQQPPVLPPSTLNHPYLLFTAEDVPRLREAASQPLLSLHEEAYAWMKEYAAANNTLFAAPFDALVWWVEGDETRLAEAIESLVQARTEGSDSDRAQDLLSASLTYDMVYDQLTEAQRRAVQTKVEEQADWLLDFLARKIMERKPADHMTWQSIAVALAAMVMPEHPKAQRWLEGSLQSLSYACEDLGGTGGWWDKGFDYWHRPSASAFPFLLWAWYNAYEENPFAVEEKCDLVGLFLSGPRCRTPDGLRFTYADTRSDSPVRAINAMGIVPLIAQVDPEAARFLAWDATHAYHPWAEENGEQHLLDNDYWTMWDQLVYFVHHVPSLPPTATPPAPPTQTIPGAGVAVLRTGWEKDDFAVFVQGKHSFSSSHSDQDANSFQVYGYETCLWCEASHSIQQRQASSFPYQRPQAHNTITYGETRSGAWRTVWYGGPSYGDVFDLVWWFDLEGLNGAALGGSYNRYAYGDPVPHLHIADLERAVLLVEGGAGPHVIIYDWIAGSHQQTWHWTLHGWGSISGKGDTRVWTYTPEGRVVRALARLVVPENAVLAERPGEHDGIAHTYVEASHQGDDVTFLAVLYPYDESIGLTAPDITEASQGEAAGFILAAGKEREIGWIQQNSAEAELAGIQSDAQGVFARWQTDELQSWWLYQGSFIKFDGGVILHSSSPIAFAALSYEDRSTVKGIFENTSPLSIAFHAPGAFEVVVDGVPLTHANTDDNLVQWHQTTTGTHTLLISTSDKGG